MERPRSQGRGLSWDGECGPCSIPQSVSGQGGAMAGAQPPGGAGCIENVLVGRGREAQPSG